MNTSRLFVASIAAICSFQMGCFAGSADAGAEALDRVELKTLEGNGTGGINGLTGSLLIENLDTIWSSTSAPFNADNADLMALQGTSTHSEIIEYLATCALPLGSYTLGWAEYEGKNTLNSTSGWLTGALGTQAKYDLIECMLAHVNPSGAHVPIRLTGQAITNQATSTQASEFGSPEALWVAYEPIGGVGLQIEVWPLPMLLNQCGEYTTQAVAQRACGAGNSLTAYCPVTVRLDPEEWCSKDAETGDWTCNGHRAIQTWLKTAEPLTMYPDCGSDP